MKLRLKIRESKHLLVSLSQEHLDDADFLGCRAMK
jgi:hypothetical protein